MRMRHPSMCPKWTPPPNIEDSKAWTAGHTIGKKCGLKSFT